MPHRPLSLRSELVRTFVTVAMAAGVIGLSIAKPALFPVQQSHPPVFVAAEPMLDPLVVKARRPAPRRIIKRAVVGDTVAVALTWYCLKGRTRRSNEVRPGIVAADPRVFPLAHHVEIYAGKRYLGRFLVDDTGLKVKGNILDIWTESCQDARQLGRQRGYAVLVKP